MTAVLMAVVGFFAGFALDEVIARFAREPFDREPDDAPAAAQPHRHALDLTSEVGTVALPWGLTGGAAYRRATIIALTSLLFALAGLRYSGHAADLAIASAWLGVLLVCAATDIIAYRVPNAVTYPAIAVALAVGMVMPGGNRLDVAAGGLLAGGLFFVCALLPGAPMGMGDVKLAFFIGFALGLTLVIPAMLVMAVSGGVVAAVLLVLKLLGRRKLNYMFYAPFISLGAAVVILAQGTATHLL
ncbi:MAG TPA: prepilin peptidase [Dehalococcoidia bacterium]|nr:prepilin peptidase [Dehalococcoidia bacterium]